MLRALGTLLGLLALSAWAAEFRPLNRSTCRSDGRSRMCMDPGTGGSGGVVPQPVFRMLTADGAGVPVMDPSGVCGAFASEMVGSYVCMRGDGTAALGPGVTLTASGGVTTTAPRICPNGPDCTAVSVQSFDGITARTANQSAAPAGGFTMCLLARPRSEATVPATLRLSAGAFLKVDTNATVFSVNGTTHSTAIPYSVGRWVFACNTYTRGGAGSSNSFSFVDGAFQTQNAAMNLPAAGDFPLVIGNQAASDAVDVGLALYTEKVVAPLTIQAMAARVYGAPLAGSLGEPVTFSRASVAQCLTPDGIIQPLRANWPCVLMPAGFSTPAIMVEGSRTNVALFSQQLDSWTPTAATVQANAATAPDGATTAEQITDNSTAGEHLVTRTTNQPGTIGHVLSAHLKAGTSQFAYLKYGAVASAIVNVTTGAVAATGPITTTTTQYAAGWLRVAILVPAGSTIANPTIGVGVALNASTASYAGTGSTILAWGAQLEEATLLGSYIQTDGTAANRSATQPSFAAPVGMSDGAGCGAVDVKVLTYRNVASYMRLIGVGNGLPRIIGLNDTPSLVDISDGTTGALVTGPQSALVAVIRARGHWLGAIKWASADGVVGTSTAYDGTLPSEAANYNIGSSPGGSFPAHGFIGNIALGNDPNACN